MFFLLQVFGAIAQFGQTSFPVNDGGRILKYPFAGGMNCPQFSELDANNDGLKDLFVFDRVGAQVMIFINNGNSGSTDYTYAPEFAKQFPPLLEWALLRDFDGDGIMDIFAYLSSGALDAVMVYKGYYRDNNIAFNRFHCSGYFENVLSWQPPGQEKVNIYVSGQDIPDINDIDGDGDLDIVTFAQGGGKVEFYKNNSVEKGWGRDSLSYSLADGCWGRFYETGLTKALTLSTSKTECAHPRPPAVADRGGLHAGSTVLTYDMDNDGDREILLGDISFKNINLAINGGSRQEAFMDAQINNFPDESALPVDMDIFPAPFMLDINNDGKKDFIAAPNAINGSEDQNTAWLYENTGSSLLPKFSFKQKNFLSTDMIDLGSYTYPAIGDVTGDGLQDLIVGVGNRFVSPTNQEARLVLYKNVGTESNPAFELTDDNWLNFKQFSNSTYYLAPALGDLDSDGDLDLLVGEYNGQLFFAQNQAGPGKPSSFPAIIYGYQNIDVGLHSAPFVTDLNNDSLSDLVIGERNGNINYLQNKGTTGNPQFDSNLKNLPNSENLGKIRTYEVPNITGHSAPVVLKFKNYFQILSGSENGKIYSFRGNYADLYSEFSPAEDITANLTPGTGIFSAPAFSTFSNTTDFFKVICGNARGGLTAYNVNLKSNGETIGTQASVAEINCIVFPNPASNEVVLRLNDNPPETSNLEMYNQTGNVILRNNFSGSDFIIDTHGIPRGIYLLRLWNETGMTTRKILLK